MKLINRPVKRVFTFGCSFTEYHWMTWPEVIAFDLNVPLYNFAKSGAGNQYIANKLTQAHAKYKITKDDLVIVSWTNVCREDRWVRNQWITPGNIFSQGEYDDKFLAKFVDPLGMLIRDLSTISLVKNLLENINCQYHFLSMVEIAKQPDQGGTNNWTGGDSSVFSEVTSLYKNELDSILPSFYKVLWNNDIHKYKFAREDVLFENMFSDGHPLPDEQLKYLELTFTDHVFNKKTKKSVNDRHKKTVDIIKDTVNCAKRKMSVYEFSNHNYLKETTTLVKKINENLI